MALTRPKYSQIYDTDWKQSVEVATVGSDVGNLTLGNLQPSTLDGQSLSIGNRVLVKDQTNGWDNGIYKVANVGTGSNGWWIRSADTNQSGFMTSGMIATITTGTVNKNKQFELTTVDPIIVGVTSLTFTALAAQPSGANTQVQFNDNNIMGASPGFTFNKFTNAVSIGGNLTTINAGNISAGGYFLGSGQFLTGLPASYSNVNVKAYTETMGFANYSNVNVAAYLGGNITVGNIIVSTGAGQFNGPFNESTTIQGVYVGNLNLSPRIGFFNGTAAQNWQIDNNFGSFRWYTPGVVRMTIDTGGNLNVPSGNIMTAGNVTARYILGSGQFLTGLPASYSNVQVAAYLPTYTGNIGKIYYDPNNGFMGFNDTTPDYVYDFYTPDNAGEILHIEGGVGTQAYFGARNSSGLNYTAGADQNYAFSGTKDTTNDYALITNNLVRANIQGSSGNVIFTQSITVAKDVSTNTLGVQEFRATASNIFVRSAMTFAGTNLYGIGKLAIGTESPGSEAFTVLGGASYFDRDVTISGNLFVNGNTTTFTSNNITLRDSIIYLADNNPADTVDIGFVGSFNNVIRYQHTGFVRDATDGVWKLFANVVPEPTTTIDFTNATYANLLVGNITTTTVGASLINSTGNVLATGLSVFGNVALGSLASPGSLNTLAGNVSIQGVSSMLNVIGNIIVNNTAISSSNVTGAIVTTGGIGVGGNLYVGQRMGYVWGANNVSSVYQIFNNSTNSLDTVFG